MLRGFLFQIPGNHDLEYFPLFLTVIDNVKQGPFTHQLIFQVIHLMPINPERPYVHVPEALWCTLVCGQYADHSPAKFSDNVGNTLYGPGRSSIWMAT